MQQRRGVATGGYDSPSIEPHRLVESLQQPCGAANHTPMTKSENDHRSGQVFVGPISPELVLVDPDLAEIARERLKLADNQTLRPALAATSKRETGEEDSSPHARGSESTQEASPEPVVDTRAALDLAVMRARASEAAAVESAARQARRRRKYRLGAVVGAMSALAVGIGGIAMRSSVDVDLASDETERTREAEPAQSASGARTTRAAPRSAPPPASPPARRQQSPPPKVPPPQQPFATRTFVWPSVSGARFYRVEFFRRRSKVFEASPTKTRLELPLRWSFRGRRFRLTPGTYRWEVRPAFGSRSRPRLGPPITQSTWLAE